jgi:DnaJ-like protein
MARPLFTDLAIQIVAEDKIAAAMRGGEFDRLPGLGQPLPFLDEPDNEDWFIKSKVESGDIQAPRMP